MPHLRVPLLVLLLAVFIQSSETAMLKAFLGRCRSIPSKLTVCIGNEAADADSIISSLCLAYLRQGEADNSLATSATTTTTTRSYLPLVSVPRGELKLRRETELLLQSVHLELSDLICLDEVNLGEMCKQGRLDSVILVDHNSLSKKLEDSIGAADSGSLVEEIFDHHKDAGLYPQVTQAHRRHIAFDDSRSVATVGSTCTLIAEEFERVSSPLLLNEHVATLLLGVISLDTSNGDAAVGKAEPRDHAAMAKLQAISGGVDRDALYARLRDAKMDPAFWRSLSTEQCLLLDYKQDSRVGIASVLEPLQDFVVRPEFVFACQQYMDSCSLEILVVMTFVLNPAPARQLLLVTRTSEKLETAHTFLSAQQSLHLSQLDLIDDDKNQGADAPVLHMRGYAQGNVKASRKQVMPLVMAFYSESR